MLSPLTLAKLRDNPTVPAARGAVLVAATGRRKKRHEDPPRLWETQQVMYSPALWRRKLSAFCSFLSRCLFLRRDRLGTPPERDARRQLRCCGESAPPSWLFPTVLGGEEGRWSELECVWIVWGHVTV